MKVFEGGRGLVERIKADGFKIVAASSAQSKEMEKLLEIAGVADLIECRTRADDAGKSKPDPDIVLMVL